MARRKNSETLLRKIEELPLDRKAQVEDFVDFLRLRDEGAKLTRAAETLSERALQEVWDNPDDAEYDRT